MLSSGKRQPSSAADEDRIFQEALKEHQKNFDRDELLDSKKKWIGGILEHAENTGFAIRKFFQDFDSLKKTAISGARLAAWRSLAPEKRRNTRNNPGASFPTIMSSESSAARVRFLQTLPVSERQHITVMFGVLESDNDCSSQMAWDLESLRHLSPSQQQRLDESIWEKIDKFEKDMRKSILGYRSEVAEPAANGGWGVEIPFAPFGGGKPGGLPENAILQLEGRGGADGAGMMAMWAPKTEKRETSEPSSSQPALEAKPSSGKQRRLALQKQNARERNAALEELSGVPSTGGRGGRKRDKFREDPSSLKVLQDVMSIMVPGGLPILRAGAAASDEEASTTTPAYVSPLALSTHGGEVWGRIGGSSSSTDHAFYSIDETGSLQSGLPLGFREGGLFRVRSEEEGADHGSFGEEAFDDDGFLLSVKLLALPPTLRQLYYDLVITQVVNFTQFLGQADTNFSTASYFVRTASQEQHHRRSSRSRIGWEVVLWRMSLEAAGAHHDHKESP